MSEVYGVDLGTRNTAVECKSGRLAMRGGTIPSAVAYDRLSTNIKFGDEATAILRSADAVERERWNVATSFKTALESDAPFVATPTGSKTAAQVLEDYLRALTRYAIQQGLPPLTKAALSIPVGFGALSRTRLLAAARNAGIEPLGIVSESTAAYLESQQVQGAAPRVAIVDWGAGTLDVSVLHVAGGGLAGAIIEEQACKGSRVAGDHIDMAIYEALAARARQDGRQIDAVDRVPAERLRSVLSACERAKISLSDREAGRTSTEIVVPAFTDGKFAKFTLTVRELECLAAPAINEAFRILEESVIAAGLSIGQLDRIVFVGGCTGVVGFQEEANRRYPQVAMFPQNPEWVVAGGALRVANGQAAYESLQEFGCVLDDGYFLPLTQSSSFDDSNFSVAVAATESTSIASLVFAERQGDRLSLAGALAVPLQGHLGEPIHIRTTLRRELTVCVEAWSKCCHESRDLRRLDIVNTRFRFRVR